MILIFFHGIYLQVFLSDLIILEEENAIKYAKRLPPQKDESLKNYAIFRFSCKPRGTISSVAEPVFEKKCCKSVAKTVTRKVPSPETRINTGFFGTSKPRGTTPTPQIALQTKRFCLGNLSCGISIIHFVLYCTWLLMLRYHFVSTFDNELCNLWRQCVPGGLLLIWYYSADWGGCQEGMIPLAFNISKFTASSISFLSIRILG